MLVLAGWLRIFTTQEDETSALHSSVLVGWLVTRGLSLLLILHVGGTRTILLALLHCLATDWCVIQDPITSSRHASMHRPPTTYSKKYPVRVKIPCGTLPCHRDTLLWIGRTPLQKVSTFRPSCLQKFPRKSVAFPELDLGLRWPHGNGRIPRQRTRRRRAAPRKTQTTANRHIPPREIACLLPMQRPAVCSTNQPTKASNAS